MSDLITQTIVGQSIVSVSGQVLYYLCCLLQFWQISKGIASPVLPMQVELHLHHK